MRAHLHGLEALLTSHCMQEAPPAPAAMAPLDPSHPDRPKRSSLPPKASLKSLKSRGSILSHVTSGTWEEDADIENPHLAEEARKTPKVQAYALICRLQACQQAWDTTAISACLPASCSGANPWRLPDMLQAQASSACLLQSCDGVLGKTLIMF